MVGTPFDRGRASDALSRVVPDPHDVPGEVNPMLRGKCLDVSVRRETVRVELNCGDAYAARVLFDDLVDRIRRGRRVSIQLRALTKENGRTMIRPLPLFKVGRQR